MRNHHNLDWQHRQRHQNNFMYGNKQYHLPMLTMPPRLLLGLLPLVLLPSGSMKQCNIVTEGNCTDQLLQSMTGPNIPSGGKKLLTMLLLYPPPRRRLVLQNQLLHHCHGHHGILPTPFHFSTTFFLLNIPNPSALPTPPTQPTVSLAPLPVRPVWS